MTGLWRTSGNRYRWGIEMKSIQAVSSLNHEQLPTWVRTYAVGIWAPIKEVTSSAKDMNSEEKCQGMTKNPARPETESHWAQTQVQTLPPTWDLKLTWTSISNLICQTPSSKSSSSPALPTPFLSQVAAIPTSQVLSWSLTKSSLSYLTSNPSEDPKGSNVF